MTCSTSSQKSSMLIRQQTSNTRPFRSRDAGLPDPDSEGKTFASNRSAIFGRGPALYLSQTSTRRFLSRLTSFSLQETGSAGPYPRTSTSFAY